MQSTTCSSTTWSRSNRDAQPTRFGSSRPTRFSLRLAVPVYYDRRYEDQFEATLRDDDAFKGFTSMTVAEMIRAGLLTVRGGHGSPSQEQRVGDVPYIKVSDLRAGTVNINPTNRVPRAVARRQFWKESSSGLRPYDLLSPERTSKNIGDFCVLMPGQEQVVVTKEVIILRPGASREVRRFLSPVGVQPQHRPRAMEARSLHADQPRGRR